MPHHAVRAAVRRSPIRWRATVAICVAAMVVSACGSEPTPDGRSETSGRPPAPEATAAQAADRSASSTAAQKSAPTAREVRLIRHLVQLSRRPSRGAADRLPLADDVALGLGPELRGVLDAADAAERSAWTLEAAIFRGHTGPFNALETIGRFVRRPHRPGAAGAPADVVQVSVGDHPHCAAGPVAAPDGYEHHRRVSLQPAEGAIDSCLSWFTVDLFVDEDGIVVAITLDLWEP